MTDSSSSAAAGGSDDPSGFVTSPPSTHVKVINTARDDLNGQIGLVVGYNSERGRYNVSIIPGQGGGGGTGTARPGQAAADAAAARAAGRSSTAASSSYMSFKPDNLVRATKVEQLRAQAYLAKLKLSQYVNDPRVREQFRRTYTSVDRRLPDRVKPEHAAAAVAVLWFVLARVIGFSKAIMLTSLLTLIPVVAAPDLLNGADVKTTARNFPRRWREAIVQSTGFGRITERQAMIGFAVLMALSLKLLLTPVAGGGGAATTAAMGASAAKGGGGASGLDGGGGGGAVPPVPPAVARSVRPATMGIEEAYRLGFDDATDGKVYGASLPDLTAVKGGEGGAAAAGRARAPEMPDDPIDWPYDPTPPPQSESGSKFGFGFMMAGFALFRFVKELAVNPDGRFDQQLFVANLRVQPPWKFAVVAFCAYRILSAFF